MKEIKSLRVGVIGVGSMGQNHARVYSEISDLVGVADLNEERAKLVANRFGVKWYSDYTELLKKVDAVTIAVPTFLHLEVAIKAAEAGVHILVEKPLSSNTKDAKKIIECAKLNNIILSVGHIERYNPAVSYVKEAINSGKLGKVITISSKRVSRYPERIKDVGVIFDLAIHDIDIINYLANDNVSKVFASGGKLEYRDLEDHATILLEYANGIKGSCEVNWLTPMKVRQTILTCTNAYVIMDYTEQSVTILRSKFGEVIDENLSLVDNIIDKEVVDLEKKEPLKVELSEFLKGVQKGINHSELRMVTGEEGLVAVKIAEEILGLIEK